MHIGACITDGVLHATVMRREANGHVTILATAEMDAASLVGHDVIAKMLTAAQEPVALTVSEVDSIFDYRHKAGHLRSRYEITDAIIAALREKSQPQPDAPKSC